MSLEQSLSVIDRDMEGFQRMADQLESEEWQQFCLVLEKIRPHLIEWHHQNQAHIPGVMETTRLLGFDEDMNLPVFRVLGYLSGEGVKLLESFFEFREGNKSYPVSSTDAFEISENGIFHHPETGLPVKNAKSKIYLEFRFRKNNL